MESAQNNNFKIINNEVYLYNQIRIKAFKWAKNNYKKYKANNRDEETRFLNAYYGMTSEIAFKCLHGNKISKVRLNEFDPGYDFTYDFNGESFKINVKSLDSLYKQYVSYNDRYDSRHEPYYSLMITDGKTRKEALIDSINSGNPEVWTYIGTISFDEMNKHKFVKQGWSKPCVYKQLFENSKIQL